MATDTDAIENNESDSLSPMTSAENARNSIVERHNAQALSPDEDGEVIMSTVYSEADDELDEEKLDNSDKDKPSLPQEPNLPPGLKLNEKGEWIQVLKIDGREVETPYGHYNSQVQKYAAGDNRLREGVEFQKQLTAHEEKLRAREAQLKEQEDRLAASLKASNPLPSTDMVSDEAIDRESTDIVEALFAGDKDAARQAVSNLLVSAKSPRSQPIDTDELLERAAEHTVTKIEQKQRLQQEQEAKRVMGEAYDNFATTFTEIVSDSKLFDLADREAEIIAIEHPDWSPSQVMTEAGTRIRTQMQDQDDNSGNDEDEPSETRSPTVDVSSRVQHKANLQPIPMARNATRTQSPQEKEIDTSPAGVLSQMREHRRGLRNEV